MVVCIYSNIHHNFDRASHDANKVMIVMVKIRFQVDMQKHLTRSGAPPCGAINYGGGNIKRLNMCAAAAKVATTLAKFSSQGKERWDG